jgi:hypothetical protein
MREESREAGFLMREESRGGRILNEGGVKRRQDF